MNLYHISQTLKVGQVLKPGYDGKAALCLPFMRALECGEDCFYGMILNGKYIQAVLEKSGLREWSDYAKWATEGAFEFIRKTEFPDSYGRLSSNFFYDDLQNCKYLYDYDWGGETEEERLKVHLFEVKVDDRCPQKRDMKIFDEAYEEMKNDIDIKSVFDCARRYFSGSRSESPVWEIISDKRSKAFKDISFYLRKV